MRKVTVFVSLAVFIFTFCQAWPALGQQEQRAARPNRYRLRQQMLKRFDKDGDGRLSPEERQDMMRTLRQGRQGGGEGRQRLDAEYKRYQTRVERYIYKRTPQGELAMYIHFPKDWTAKDRRPAMVFFFGGAWTTGNVEQFTRQAHYLAWRGMIAARADYRVRSRHQVSPDKCVQDAKSAVRWLRKNAAKFGIDPNRIVASGGSAGGHIAACTYTTTDLDAEGEDTKISARPNLLVLYNPVLDCTNEQIVRRMGSMEMARRLSPNLHLSKDMPPAIVFYGTEDKFVEHGRQFLRLSKKLGNTVELYVAEGQPHGFFNRSPWHQRTTFLADQFLTKHGYLQGRPALKLPHGDIGLKKLTAEEQNQKRQGKPKPQRPPLGQTVKAGQPAPDFELPRLSIVTDKQGKKVGKISTEKVRLSSFRGKKPVFLIFSSYT